MRNPPENRQVKKPFFLFRLFSRYSHDDEFGYNEETATPYQKRNTSVRLPYLVLKEGKKKR